MFGCGGEGLQDDSKLWRTDSFEKEVEDTFNHGVHGDQFGRLLRVTR